MNIFQKISNWYRKLPDKKRYFELITAVLTIPVLLTVLIGNLQNIQNRKSTPTPSVVPQDSTDTKTPADNTSVFLSPIPTPNDKNPAITIVVSPQNSNQDCIAGIGIVEIIYPEENEIISQDPVCIDISYNSKDYCPLVWSYKIDSQTWSEFTDKEICLYNLSAGVKTLSLKVKSLSSGEEKILKRTFTLSGDISPTSGTSTQSAYLLP